MPKTEHQIIGAAGEDFASHYLEKRGYQILKRNYLRKWGEIDIIAKLENVLYFVEVKTRALNFHINSREFYHPEENLHRRKLARIKRAIMSYLAESKVSIESEWEFSAITVILRRKTRELYKIEHLENLII